MRTREAVTLMIVSLAASFSSPQSTNCDFGWFGSSCQYKCRCKQDRCREDGVCVGSTVCQEGWFGLQCQYADLAFNRSTLSALTDGSEVTCLTSGGTVEVTLVNSYVFTWLRVHFGQEGFLHKLSVQFRQNSTTLTCNNLTSTNLDTKSLDIYCDLSGETVEAVILTGEGVKHLCSLYVSGGRNVALRQPTQQSSTHSQSAAETNSVPTNFTSDKAVDGNRDPDPVGHSCSSTAIGDRNASFNVTFLKPQSVNRYAIYNAADNKPQRWVLTSYDTQDRVVFHHADASRETNVSVYTIISPGVATPISRVFVSTTDPNGVLAMCELEIYGDSVCQAGQFGHECQSSCHCDGGEPCFVSTGQCPYSCSPGFIGLTCSDVCEAGTFGHGCNFICSPSCQKPKDIETKPCHPVDGSCTLGCSDGFSDPMCSTDIRDGIMFKVVLALTIQIIVIGLLCTALMVFLLKKRQSGKTINNVDVPDRKTGPRFSQVSQETVEPAETVVSESASEVSQAEDRMLEIQEEADEETKEIDADDVRDVERL